MKKIIYTLVLIMSLIATVSASEELRTATLESAYAYLRKGPLIQYDTYRINSTSHPEDATLLSPVYTVCSTFVEQIYYDSLGITIPDTTSSLLEYANNNQNTSNIILYSNNQKEIYSDNLLTSDITNVDIAYNNLEKLLKTGDILVIKRKDNTGHAMYIDASDNEIYVIESSGNEYNYQNNKDSYEKKGSIVRKTLKEKIQIFLNDYNKENNKRSVTEFAIIRYINEDTNYTLTKEAETRIKYPKMDINESISIKSDKKTSLLSISLDNELTYTISIKNNSDETYKDLVITCNIDPKVKIIKTNQGKLNNKTLTFKIDSILPNKEYKISYKVKIPKEKSLIGQYIISNTYVDNIKLKPITNYINHTLLKDEENKIIKSYNKLKNSTKLNDSTFILSIYKEAIGLDISFLNNLKLNDIIAKDGCNKTDITCREYLKNSEAKKIVIPTFYGYSITEGNINDNNIYAYLAWSSSNTNYKERTRTLTEEYLEIGDIIMTDNKSYLYLGNNLLVTKNSTYDTNILKNIVGDSYAILRPAYLFDRNYDIKNPDTNKNLKLVEFITISLLISLIILLILKKKRLYK